MTAWAALRRIVTGVFLLLLGAAAASGDEPGKSPRSPASQSQLRALADAAEKAGDWDAAFAAYCRLYAANRNTPEIREKLNVSLRRAQQVRRHRDPQFQKFVATTTISDALNLFGEVLTKVPVLYVDRDRCTPQQLWESGIDELSRALASPSFRQAFLDNDEKASDRIEGFRAGLRYWARQPIADAKTARMTLRKLITALQGASNVRVPSAIVLEMVCGSCNGLDEYTVFLTPAHANSEAAAVPDLSAQGVYLAIVEGEVLIAGIAPGSWADCEAKNLHKGDRITQLNGRSMLMATPGLVVEALRAAPVGGMHELVVAGGPEDDQVFLHEHLPVNVPTVFGVRVLKDAVGYVRIGSFAPSTPQELDAAINQLRNLSRGMLRGVIIDLRGCLGGSFMASVETAKRLIPNGLIVTTQGQVSEVSNHPFSSDSGMSAHDVPLVVLINAETASAAEVLAAALKDNNRATLIGLPTFGKGAIQYPLKLASLDEVDDQGKPQAGRSGMVRLTIAKLIAPRSGPINGVGITPHIMEAAADQQLILAIEKFLDSSPSPVRPLMNVEP